MIIILNLQNIVSSKILSTEKIMNNNHTPPNENGVDVGEFKPFRLHGYCYYLTHFHFFYSHSIYSHKNINIH